MFRMNFTVFKVYDLARSTEYAILTYFFIRFYKSFPDYKVVDEDLGNYH